jgi:DNA-binding CsgD family transcriptional regulator
MMKSVGERESEKLFPEVFADHAVRYLYAYYLSCLIECSQRLYGLKEALEERIAEEIAAVSHGTIQLYLHRQQIGNEQMVPYVAQRRPFLVQWGERVYGSLHYKVNEKSSEMILPVVLCERLARDCGWCLHVLEQGTYVQLKEEGWSEEAREKIGALSHAQCTVLQLMVKGLSTRAIADCLQLSKRTVETHQRYIYQELDVHSQREAISIGLAAGLSAD